MGELRVTGERVLLPVILARRERWRAGEGQCDACPPAASSSFSPDAPALAADYQPPSALRTISLDEQHRLAYASSLSMGPVVLNQAALAFLRRFEGASSRQEVLDAQVSKWGREISEQVLEEMLSLRLLVPDSGPSLEESAQKLVAWLHVTRDCNLQCSYCYLDSVPEEMAWETGREAIDSVFRSALHHDLSEVKLKYAGGEPTLAFPLVARLHRRAIEWAEKSALALDGVVISNGVSITHGMLETMRDLGIRLTISLDGLGKYHDSQRHFADGTGSFEDVSETIQRALNVGLTPEVSITATHRNLAGLPALVGWLLERDLPFGLDFARARSSREGSPVERQHLIESMLEVLQVVECNLPSRSLLASLVDRANLACPHTRTCGVGANYLVVDPEGNIAKCQMDIDSIVTDVSADDPLADLRADQTGIRNLPVDEKDDCRNCRWRYWCGGGCPLETYRTTGRWDAKSSYCDVYKALFPEVLRLEGLRLLKYGEKERVDAE